MAVTNFSFLLTLVSTDENDQTHHELRTADKGDNDVRSKQKALTRLLPLDYQAPHGVNLIKMYDRRFHNLVRLREKERGVERDIDTYIIFHTCTLFKCKFILHCLYL